MKRPRLRSILAVTAWALPIAEIVAIIWVAHLIGAGWTVLLLVAGFVLGLALIQKAGQRSIATLLTSARRGQVPTAQLAQSGWVAFGGLLIAIPGFITDVLGVLVMIPIMRRVLGRLLGSPVAVKATWVPPVDPSQGDDAEPTVVRGDVL